MAILLALFGGIVRDSLIGVGGVSDALDAGKHVLLSQTEARNVCRAVAELGEGGGGIVLVVWKFFQAQEAGHGSAAGGPRAGVDGYGTTVKEAEGALLKIEPEAVGTAAQAELVPEVAG